MGFLRRLLGDGAAEPAVEDPSPPADAAAADTEEAAYELDVLREEQARLSELVRRQMRYADYAWTPPAQGGERRADDEDRASDTGSRDGEPG